MELDTIKYPWPPSSLDVWLTETEAKPDPIWLIPNLIPYDCSVLVSGRAKLGFKSWFMFFLSLSIALGKSCSQIWNPTKAEKILFLEMEKPAKLTAKRWIRFLSAFNVDREAIKDKIFFAHRYPITVDSIEDINRISLMIRDNGIKILIIDTLAEAHRGGESRKEDLDLAMAAVRRFKADMNGGVVFFLHHLRKMGPQQECDSGDIDEDIRGSSALAGFYDTHLAMRHYSSLSQKYIDLVVRQSEVEEQRFKLTWHIDDKSAYPEFEAQNPDDISDMRLSQFMVQLRPNKQYSVSNLIKQWSLSFDMVNSITKKLEERGELIRGGNGKFVTADSDEGIDC